MGQGITAKADEFAFDVEEVFDGLGQMEGGVVEGKEGEFGILGHRGDGFTSRRSEGGFGGGGEQIEVGEDDHAVFFADVRRLDFSPPDREPDLDIDF